MANQITTIAGYVSKIMGASVAVTPSVLMENSNKDYQDVFEENVNGYDIGDEFTINREAIYHALDGYVDGTDITGLGQDFIEDPIIRVANCNPIVPPQFKDSELTFDIKQKNKTAIKRKVKPVGDALREGSERTGFDIYNSSADNVSYHDIEPSDGYRTLFSSIKAKMIEGGASDNDVVAIIDEAMQNKLAYELEEAFNPVKNVEDAFKGKFHTYNSIKFATSQRIPKHITGTVAGGVVTLASNYVSGATSMVLTDITGLKVGDVIEAVAGNVLNQRTGEDLGRKFRRAVRAIDSGTDTITITPIHLTATDPRKNVSVATISAADTFTVLGTDATDYRCYPVYCKSAWGYAHITQAPLDATKEVEAVNVGGYKVRYCSQADIKTAITYQRAEMLQCWFDIRSEFMGTVRIKTSLLA